MPNKLPTEDNRHILSNEEIIDFLMEDLGLEKDTDLAAHFGVQRQRINQFKSNKGRTLTHQIITYLITKNTLLRS